ncbi:MAG: protein-L-isoaspartate(D-aspartate) O-methyltransferase [Candidatus Marinimicrobia bacterium]|mgnify:FL=1|jgi:protein-L-isoaspartate(D-aspartate) O-methyltransferase|nr:protein-L-isoaspartate(D-aspartate) O-methyltransferase [Candidatus Neomarinimicrobiota bacterium]MDP6401283.1 protein-L-isoaspartate(D-aspartate) O-methyltransferase [Candidatus Neomarinimicrobiota bacterium]MDP6614480.1 protein-L-isoaspartate(D-aspartate) O-methyltransferase [Candidatus Neomarinimicrobiota bacterium]MDP6861679.1 protein-L-isoaspartate(D-aspartate) O-methyltransferase [Candidatus Neomarinimicrobiota bacterium]HJM34764.1 protein-L-isoaspartate(D-aspartate) O-methyltransferas|tara:strand:+ start:141 stop:830 length:690 start_codon:yes stop_codon:yes gene_type:complete
MKWTVLFFLLFSISCTQNDPNFDHLRKVMIKNQLQSRGIRDDAVLDVMRSVERHNFVPENYRDRAYSDGPLPIGHGQTISQPYIVAFMTEQLQVSSQHKILEIGTGSGYQAAILGELAKHVFTIEIIPELAEGAKNILNHLSYKNITVRAGDGYKGWPEEAPFERIMVTAAPTEVPQELIDQLAPGGRMILPVGAQFLVQYLWVIEKDDQGTVTKEKILPVRFVPMVKE